MATKASVFIAEFTVTDPVYEYEFPGDIYVYKKPKEMQPGYYLKRHMEKSKSLFFLMQRPHNYKATKFKQNEETIYIDLIISKH